MEILDIIGGALSIGSGGIFGFLGATVSSVFKHFQRKQEFEQQLILREEDRKDFKQQMAFSAQETEEEIAIDSNEGSWTGLNSSIQAAAQITGSDWSSKLLRMFRPFLTISLVCISAGLIKMIWDSAVNAETNGLSLLFAPGELKELLRYGVFSIFFSASTAVVWWFGDRAMTPPHMKGR